VGLQEETVFRAIRFCLGGHYVREPRHRNLHPFDAKHTSFAPDFVELESRHDECEIDFQPRVVGRFGQRLSLDDAIR